MAGYIESINSKVMEYAKPMCSWVQAQLQQTSGLYADQCHEAGQWVGRQVDNEMAAQVAETALKAAPVTAFCFALYATMSTPAILALGVCATAIVLTHPDILSNEGKEVILTGLACAVVLNTAYHVMAALATLHLEALVFSLVVGAAQFLTCYSCLQVVQEKEDAENGDDGELDVDSPQSPIDAAAVLHAGREVAGQVVRAGQNAYALYNAAAAAKGQH